MINRQDRFISIDWGTSSFRMRLISLANERILEEYSSNHGVAILDHQWKTENSKIAKLDYCKQFLTVQLEKWKGLTIEGTPIMISGMASSSIGMVEVDYKTIPFNLGTDLPNIKQLQSTEVFPHPIYLVGGLRSDKDVMRGEETLLLGMTKDEINFSTHIVLPGTHSKHIVLKDDQLVYFQTYMTGELFELLSARSILKGSVEPSDFDVESFQKGVEAAVKNPLLNAIFLTRTNRLMNKLSTQQNYHWLSGLLIGFELEAFKQQKKVTLIVGSKLHQAYELALKQLNPGIQVQVLEEASKISMGQIDLYKRINNMEQKANGAI